MFGLINSQSMLAFHSSICMLNEYMHKLYPFKSFAFRFYLLMHLRRIYIIFSAIDILGIYLFVS